MRFGIKCLVLILGSCTVASGQTSLPTFYIFQRFDGAEQMRAQPIGFAPDPRMMAMVTINVGSGNVDHDPVRAADKVMDFIRARLADPSLGLLDPNDIAISLVGFAHEHKPQNSTSAAFTAMRDPSDPLVPRPGQVFTWPPGFSAPPGSINWYDFMLIHPWMEASRARLREWTRTFMGRIVTRHASERIPLPRRWALDVEDPLFNCCDVEWSHFILNVMKDARWSTAAVPGFTPQRTMAQLLAEANAEFGWNLLTGDGTALNPGFDPNLGGPQAIPNRPLAYWFARTVGRARSAVLAESAYDPIREAYAAYRVQHPSEIVPDPIVSNYSEIATDGDWDTVGWHEDKLAHLDQATGSQLPELAAYDQRSRAAIRGQVGTDNEGARHGHTMLVNWFGSAYAQARWAVIPSMTWSDRDSVSLYDCRVVPSPFYSHAQRDLYRPGLPAETINQTCLRLNRRRLEAVLNSVVPGHTQFPLPYILFTGESGIYDITADDEMTLSVLAMLRAKGVTEIVPFTDDIPRTNLAGWRGMQSAYQRVWAYQLTGFRWAIGAEPRGTIGTVADLHDTLRVVSGGEQTDATSSSLAVFTGTFASTQLETTFKPLLGVRTDAIRINLECQVLPGPFYPYAAGLTEGEVWLWDFTLPAGGNWRRLHIGEGLTDPARYRIVTPDFSTRRTFDVYNAARFIGPNGEVHVRLGHYAPADYWDDRFESRYDLVQLVALHDLDSSLPATRGLVSPEVECPTCVTVEPYSAETTHAPAAPSAGTPQPARWRRSEK